MTGVKDNQLRQPFKRRNVTPGTALRPLNQNAAATCNANGQEPKPQRQCAPRKMSVGAEPTPNVDDAQALLDECDAQVTAVTAMDVPSLSVTDDELLKGDFFDDTNI